MANETSSQVIVFLSLRTRRLRKQRKQIDDSRQEINEFVCNKGKLAVTEIDKPVCADSPWSVYLLRTNVTQESRPGSLQVGQPHQVERKRSSRQGQRELRQQQTLRPHYSTTQACTIHPQSQTRTQRLYRPKAGHNRSSMLLPQEC